MDSSTKQLMSFAMRSPLSIPEGKSGKWSIAHETHEAGTCLDIISMRKWITTGIKPVRMQLAQKRVVHKLLHNGGVVMSDLPVEMADHMKFCAEAKGNVLIGGLGLGYIATKLLENGRVKRIEVVEKERDVIRLVAPYTDRRVKIIHADLFEYLKAESLVGFDTAYFDIWTGTGERTWDEYVVPLRRLVNKGNPCMAVFCWAEDVMIGQYGNLNGPTTGALFWLAAFEPDKLLHFRPHWVFCAALKVSGIPVEFIDIKAKDAIGRLLLVATANQNNTELKKFVELYLHRVGTPLWEETFGALWDRWAPCNPKNKRRPAETVANETLPAFNEGAR